MENTRKLMGSSSTLRMLVIEFKDIYHRESRINEKYRLLIFSDLGKIKETIELVQETGMTISTWYLIGH